MEIRVGWATDFGREKFDVSLDDGDLTRILGDYNIDPALVSTAESFGLLRAYANWLAATEAVRFNPAQQSEVNRWLQGISDAVQAIIARIYGPAADVSAAA